MTFQNGSQLYVLSGSIAGADITLQSGAQIYNSNAIVNFSNSTTRITFDASSNGNGGQLYLYGKSTTLGRISSIASGGQISGGASTGTTNTLTVSFDATTSTYGGTIVEGGPGGSGGSLALVKSGTGTLVLSGNNTYTGGFSAGTYDLIDATGASLSNINSANFSLGTSIPGYNYAFIQSGNRFQVVATVIPEPASALLVMIGAATLFLRRRAPILSAL
jgi:autotransporter-associated beta strand protein